jgi:hypothetical protein
MGFSSKYDGFVYENKRINIYRAFITILRITESRRMKWVGCIAQGGDDKCIQNFG